MLASITYRPKNDYEGDYDELTNEKKNQLTDATHIHIVFVKISERTSGYETCVCLISLPQACNVMHKMNGFSGSF